jgi:hypothetical protein
MAQTEINKEFSINAFKNACDFTDIGVIVDEFKKLPKQVMMYVFFQMLRDDEKSDENRLTFADLAEMETRYLKALMNAENEKYFELQREVVTIWTDHKKNWRENLKNAMRVLLRHGRINITEEKIEKF